MPLDQLSVVSGIWDLHFERSEHSWLMLLASGD